MFNITSHRQIPGIVGGAPLPASSQPVCQAVATQPDSTQQAVTASDSSRRRESKGSAVFVSFVVAAVLMMMMMIYDE